jgi:hypothetical protein
MFALIPMAIVARVAPTRLQLAVSSYGAVAFLMVNVLVWEAKQSVVLGPLISRWGVQKQDDVGAKKSRPSMCDLG